MTPIWSALLLVLAMHTVWMATRARRSVIPAPTIVIQSALVAAVVAVGRSIAAVSIESDTRDVDALPDIVAPTLAAAAATLAFTVLATRRSGPVAATVVAAIAALCGIADVLQWRLDPAGMGISSVIAALLVSAVVLSLPERALDGRSLARAAVALLIAGILLMSAPLVPGLGLERNGARAWIVVFGQEIMPGELGRVLVVLGTASLLARNADALGVVSHRPWRSSRWFARRPLTVSTLAAVIGVLVLCVQRDLGPALVVTLAIGAACWFASGMIRYFALSAAGVLVGAVLAYPLFRHWQERVASWLEPLAPIAAEQSQAGSAETAVAWAGAWGTGLGRSIVSSLPGRVPERDTDFALLTLGAEAGFVSIVAVTVILITLSSLLWLTARRVCASAGPMSLAAPAAALASLFTLQVLVILAGVTRVVPLTGITTPILSRGGSSLLAVTMLLLLAARWADMSVGTTTASGRSIHVRRRAIDVAASVSALAIVTVIGTLAPTMMWDVDGLNGTDRSAQSGRAWATSRGDITTADGLVLATTAKPGILDSAQRRYGLGAAAADITGVAVPFGSSSGIESAWADELLCGASITAATDQASCAPANVNLTLDSRWQLAAQSALGERSGAVIVMDGTSSSVLAAYSSGSVDPGPLADHDVAGAFAAAESAANADAVPVAAPQWARRHPPGSVMKLVVYAAALSAYGDATPTMDVSDCPEVLTLDDALAISCNSVFSALAEDLGADALSATAHALGVDQQELSGLTVDPFQLTTTGGDAGIGSTSLVGIGQGDVRATLLGLVAMTGTIADGGIRSDPYLVESVSRDDTTLWSHEVPPPTRAITPEAAEAVIVGMRQVVTDGTGTELAELDGAFAAKSGTAEVGDGSYDAWIVGFPTIHNVPEMDVVIGVLVLPDGDSAQPVGGIDAAHVFAAVVNAAVPAMTAGTP